MLRPICATATIGLLLAAAAPAGAQSISGPAEAIDGDTLDLTGTRVRLRGIDAVEAAQSCDRASGAWACGAEAKTLMAQLADGKFVTCSGQETDAYGRLLATCRVDGLDLAEAMVGAGLAVAFGEHGAAYGEAEARAKQFALGIWAGTFDRPADWRAAHKAEEPRIERVAAPGRTGKAAASGSAAYRDDLGRCAIKGNRSRYGEWIYHLPGQAYYDATRPEEVFCTEEAAQRAGYRRSKV